MLLARCKSIHAASKIGLGKLNAGRQLVSAPCCTHPWITNTNATDGQLVITTENEGEIYPLIKFRSAEIRYPLPNLDDGLRGQNDYSGVTLAVDEDRAFASQYRRETNHRNKQLHAQKMQWSTKHHIDSREKSLHQFDLNIWPNLECNSGGGGHVVLGRNASGKTLLARSIAQSLKGIPDQSLDTYQSDTSTNPFLQSGTISIHKRNASKNRNHHFLSHVSFDSHSDLLVDKNTTTVHRALIPFGGNRLSPTAQFLSVRLGMFPLLSRRVDTLSTGEIRRVLLVRALVSKPELLVLDNAFDGLDVRGREGLQNIIERVLQGFRMDILVQGVNAKDTARTQVLLFTHRPDEIADGIGRVTFIDKGFENGIKTEVRRGRNGEELVRSLALRNDEGKSDIVLDSDLPSNVDIQSFWEHDRSTRDASNSLKKDVLFHSQNLKVTRDETTIISNLNWTVKRGERWHIAGTNGAGKSTVGRLILSASMNNNTECDSGAMTKGDARVSDGSLSITQSVISNNQLTRGGVSWVSTELHLHATHHWGNRTVREILLKGASYIFYADQNIESHMRHMDDSSIEYSNKTVNVEIATAASCWLGLLDKQTIDSINDVFLARPFSTLSQGEQKLLLVASAIAQLPSLLILDEPCQGLDLWNRARLLGLVEKICNVTDMSLLYVTHHEDELIPSISHRLCLDDGRVTYCGVM